ncbi:hypothetical protein HDIA_4413 [Hartmannibacter diazotrophicus]|uniref:DUF924 domain-containing protein n=1 Tax=Hartmannibacter diazotrophicus TaxID=1482074 RepID=A0A2C9DCA9_9HYPH|nr:DUF924 family protein [Hartmannibacter diazotrophicus]SON57954.1 hypothetical protein HDIA_4413 [Hartmannibacter diazotrophicus]
MVLDPAPLDVLDFWWRAGPERWFAKDDAFDREMEARFGALHDQACAGALDHWAEDRAGMLALILLLDQFSRNLKRGSAEAFANDSKALTLAKTALDRGDDRAFPTDVRSFFYLPLMHSEEMADQERCVDFCRLNCSRDTYGYALEHMDIIRRFGRFPHRNTVLGRETTPEEAAYLASGGFAG